MGNPFGWIPNWSNCGGCGGGVNPGVGICGFGGAYVGDGCEGGGGVGVNPGGEGGGVIPGVGSCGFGGA
ncbi:hypothetical protein ES703_104054 [subsurface metagenome]